MVFKKHQREKAPWYIWITLPGFGRVGPWSTGLRSKALARSVEAWLREAAASDPEAVRGIVEGKYSLREAYVAAKEGRLEALKVQAGDPPLSEVVRRFHATVRDRRVRDGLGILTDVAPKGARLSLLRDPKRITDLLHQAVAKGQRINSVHRSLYAAIKALLVYEVGNAEKRRITADVVFRSEDDSRDVTLSAEQAGRLLGACDPELRPLVTVAMLTGIDRGPLLRMTPAHVDFEAGTAKVPDTKSKSRLRTLELSAAALAVLRVQVAGKAPEALLFTLTEDEVTKRFRAARTAAGLPSLRFKDLRHVFASTWTATGGSLKDLGGAMGHTQSATTLRYTASQASAMRRQMDAVADRLGLGRVHLDVSKGGSA